MNVYMPRAERERERERGRALVIYVTIDVNMTVCYVYTSNKMFCSVLFCLNKAGIVDET